jgi:hypothetical protein
MGKRDRKRKRDESETNLESPLGIAGAPVTPDAPERMRAADDAGEARRRRNRGLSAENDIPRDPLADINRDHKGATGIDMGAGGHNTQISDTGTKP